MLWVLVSLLGCNGDKDEDDSGGGGGDDSGDDSGGPIGVDDDGDGYETPDDCDDSDEDVNPGATEVCDTIDNDCDTLIDAGDDSLADGVTIFTDADGDSYGDDTTERIACDPDIGTSDVGGDCDDTDGTINPDGFEICNDSVDSDCDTTEDGCTLEVDDSYAIWTGEAEGDAAGLDIAARGDLNGDGTPDVIVGARDNDHHKASNGGAAYVLFGPLQSGAFTFADADAELFSTVVDARLGRSVEFVGDWDGDKVDDIAVSAGTLSTSSDQVGRVYLIDGASASVGGDVEKLAWATLTGGAQFDYAGTDLQRGHDVTGDTVEDLWVGITGDDDAGATGGSIVLVAGPISGATSLDAQAAKLLPEGAGHALGSVMAPGDYDGDGVHDLAVGDAIEDESGAAAGAVYVVFGPVSGAFPLSGADVKLVGNAAGDTFGAAVANAGDTDDDGLDDLLVGAPFSIANDSGEAVLIETPLVSGAASGATTATFVDAFTGDQVGRSVDGGVDVDGDKVWDVLIGATGWGSTKGAAYLARGPFSGVIDLSTDSLRSWIGVTNGTQVGERVAFGGPALEGGEQAILLATPHADEGGIDAGALYVEN